MTSQLAILGGTPVRPQGYPDWPDVDEVTVQAVADAVRSGRWGGFPYPGPQTAAFARRVAAIAARK